ncbi:hypothetical protein C3K47_09665 [Solitalea longa]|uniref:Uncharacterized protein n=1 Tax=Solitalea longa TaxID=2079460 RepID=A0A2S5A218_9SPHI|nr:hypothetical protein [Solitalea longa]POY36631.1 hypothetical protein C3K47_09665 [Solitalea longa]
MKKLTLSICALLGTFLLLTLSTSGALAQSKQAKKKQTIETKASNVKSDATEALKRPENDKNNKEGKGRGDVYGDDYSDIVVDNYTNYNIDIYVDGKYRGTLGPWEKKVTWAVPGKTRMYAKAEFSDGSYSTWGPNVAETGYEYKWNLRY